MKKTFTLIIITILALMLVSCNKNKDDTETFRVYFYEYNNAYKENKENPDLFKHQVYKKGDLINEPEVRERGGYTFGGWHKSYKKVSPWDFENDVVTSNVALYALWVPIIYKVNLELNGGVFDEGSRFNGEQDEDGNYYYNYQKGTSQTLHSPTRLGYKFLGWFLTDSYKAGDKQSTEVSRDIVSDTTYYAQWQELKVTIRFVVNLDNVTEPAAVEPTRYDYGQTIDFPELVDTTGEYVFIGWNTRRNGTGDMLINGEPFDREQTTVLYAQWKLK